MLQSVLLFLLLLSDADEVVKKNQIIMNAAKEVELVEKHFLDRKSSLR